MSGNVYQWIKDSLYAYCGTFAAAMATEHPTYPAIDQYNFDAFAQQNTLPAGDFIGLRNLSVTVHAELATVECLVGLSTNDDLNLFRLEELSGELFNRFLPKQRIPVYENGPTPVQRGWLVLTDGSSLSPVTRADQRPLRYVSIRGGISLPLQAA